MDSPHAARAGLAFVQGDYSLAASLYADAVNAETQPLHMASLLAAKARSLLAANQVLPALQDALRATQLNPTDAHALLVHGLALYETEEYESAIQALNKVGSGGSSGSSVVKREAEAAKERCEAALAKEKKQVKPPAAQAPLTKPTPPTPASTPASTPTSTPPPIPSSSRFRHEWSQTSSHVTLDIFASNKLASQIRPAFAERRIMLQLLNATGQVDDTVKVSLAAPIDASSVSIKNLSNKIRVTMKKKDEGDWDAFEVVAPTTAGGAGGAAGGGAGATTSTPTPTATPTAKPLAPAPTPKLLQPEEIPKVEQKLTNPYATKKPIDWNKLSAEIEKEEKSEKPEGDQALMQLFQQIYRNADEDTRRAMNKSYQESGGTALSTNWKEVKEDKFADKAGKQ